MRPRLALGFVFSFGVLLAGPGVRPLAAQSGPQGSYDRGRAGMNQQGERTYSISGRVFDEATNEGIEGAHVSLGASVGFPLQEVYVDFTGYFIFGEVRRGNYIVTVTAPGYEEKQEMVQVMGAPVGGLTFFLRRKPQASAPVLVEPLDASQELIPKEARQEFNRGAAAAERRDWRAVVAHADKALAAYPKYVSALNAKGIAHLRLGEVESARPCFETAVKLNPNVATPRIFLGGIYNADHRYPEAAQHLVRALQLNPESWLGHFELSRAYWGLNNVDAAERHIVRAHELSQNIPQVHLMRAYVYFAREDFQGAVTELDEFLTLVPTGDFAEAVRQRRAQMAERLVAPKP